MLLPGLICLIVAASSHAQDAAAGEEGEKRVQYQLVLPEEKTPENVKPEEHNPFESESEALNRQAPGDTEENRVRDKLLKLPVVGTKRMTDGRMRVLLGDIILETGCVVPPVLPEQLVELRVKNITAQYIELAWREKRLTGLPPKLMVIPISITPQVRYQMLGQSGNDAKGTNATMDLPLRDPTASLSNTPPAKPAQATAATETMPAAEPAPPRAQLIADDPQPFAPPRVVNEPVSPAPASVSAQAAAPPKPVEAPPATAPPSPAVESVVRMLFGNPTPAPK
ncbi:MAG: hypothetical protein B7Z37_24390 [Verrucomicrobia bacterium 12-59-8]|nr:MAG: hypothetical protein B7Z37_24390 [Verrucomicrobia bacterium 12-59-8]